MITSKLTRRNSPTPEQLAEAARPMTRLEERREELRARFTEMQWDLGGAAYEMAARDYFRLDVLASMAARLQIVDAELAEIERMARLERAGAAGACAGCGSLHARGAIYCWRCGRNLFEVTAKPVLEAAPELAPEPVTEVVAAPAVAVETVGPVQEPAAVEPVPEPMAAEPVPEPQATEPSPQTPSVEAVPASPEAETGEATPPEGTGAFARPWAGASQPRAVPVPGPVMVPPFAGAVEVPTYETIIESPPVDGPASGGT